MVKKKRVVSNATKKARKLKKITTTIIMNEIKLVTFVNGDTVEFTNPTTITSTVSGVATVFSSVPAVPTEAQVQAAVDAGIIAAYTPKG